jgi:hypothetical protein
MQLSPARENASRFGDIGKNTASVFNQSRDSDGVSLPS